MTAGNPAGGTMVFETGRVYCRYLFPGAAPSVSMFYHLRGGCQGRRRKVNVLEGEVS
ncbi:hypothetical protein KKC1_23510 [Calderihabitans maritimus]|uniref:Uncharacterized protein n=1 Tax=Calderihabitans maritimus TaxID=1246530 RepID=A0A1Z5HUM2_9FIRM|nr:hypothetical protein KKC1_23510 [Calderihabitans maritimus]